MEFKGRIVKYEGVLYRVTDVDHDGNCFFLALALLLGMEEEQYMALKLELQRYFF